MKQYVINEYLVKFFATGGEDAFHSLIEEKDETVNAICDILKVERDLKTFTRAMEIVREIRTEKSFNLLCDICLREAMPYWREAAEALAYNNQVAAKKFLAECLDEKELLLKKRHCGRDTY